MNTMTEAKTTLREKEHNPQRTGPTACRKRVCWSTCSTITNRRYFRFARTYKFFNCHKALTSKPSFNTKEAMKAGFRVHPSLLSHFPSVMSPLCTLYMGKNCMVWLYFFNLIFSALSYPLKIMSTGYLASQQAAKPCPATFIQYPVIWSGQQQGISFQLGSAH